MWNIIINQQQAFVFDLMFCTWVLEISWVVRKREFGDKSLHVSFKTGYTYMEMMHMIDPVA